jgi:hypothetical protein
MEFRNAKGDENPRCVTFWEDFMEMFGFRTVDSALRRILYPVFRPESTFPHF